MILSFCILLISSQFTFLISVTWNTQGLPLIQDKLSIRSEILVKVLIPFIGEFSLRLSLYAGLTSR